MEVNTDCRDGEMLLALEALDRADLLLAVLQSRETIEQHLKNQSIHRITFNTFKKQSVERQVLNMADNQLNA